MHNKSQNDLVDSCRLSSTNISTTATVNESFITNQSCESDIQSMKLSCP